MYQWERRGRSSSSAIARLMLPWWSFTHVLQIPRKFVQFLPPMLVSHLLNFLEDGTLPMSVGYKLMLLAGSTVRNIWSCAPPMEMLHSPRWGTGSSIW